MTNEQTSNFEFRKEHDPIFIQLAHNAKTIFAFVNQIEKQVSNALH